MGIMDNLDKNTTTTTTTAAKTERPKAEFWANLGYVASNGEFVSLPFGIPLDTQNKVEVRGGDQDYVDLMTAKNDLLEAIQAKAAQLDPGESEFINLRVQVSRVKTKLTASEDSTYTEDLKNLFG